MDLARQMIRRDGGGSGLGLGWLLAIAIGGGVLFFAAVGYLLVWRIKQRATPCTTRVYANDTGEMTEDDGGINGAAGPLTSSSTNVLSKRFLHSESSMSRLSSRVSLTNLTPWNPPTLPPPSAENTSGQGPRNWINDGEADHGPRIERRSWRSSWFGRHSWAAMITGSPTLPDVGRDIEMGGGPAAGKEGENKTEAAPVHKANVLRKRQSMPPLMTSQTAPQLSTTDQDNEESRGRSIVPVPQTDEGQQKTPGHQRSNSTVDIERYQQEFQEAQDRKNQIYQQRMRASMTETDLHDILKSTEQRLRDGTSRSPAKTPQSSPVRGSPTKTPRSTRTVSSGRTVTRMTPSPSKKSLQNGSTPPSEKTLAHNVSTTSIGSAANSLILAATEELELPGGQSSPSRLRGQQWDASTTMKPVQNDDDDEEDEEERELHRNQAQMQLQSQQRSPRRRSRSLESDASSFLSTLYSVSDRDEEEENRKSITPAPLADNDPFVETRTQHQEHFLTNKPSWERRQQLTGPRPLRRAKTSASQGDVNTQAVDETALPAPLRTISTNSRINRADRTDEKRSSMRMTVVFQPPQKTLSEDVKPKSSVLHVGYRRASLPDISSAASVASESAYTDVTVSDVSNSSSQETLKAPDEDGPTMLGGPDSSASNLTGTPTRNAAKDVDLSSSPLNEREVLSMLMDKSSPKRDLPKPPTCILVNDQQVIMATPLSPRPKGQQDSSPKTVAQRPRRASIGSASSSNYDGHSSDTATEDEANLGDHLKDLPGRRATTSGLGFSYRDSANSVGSTVAELRRMNSVVSSYSAASMTSTVCGEGQINESPTLPSLRGGGFSPDHNAGKIPGSGTRNYLSLGGTSPPRAKKSSDKKKDSQNGGNRQRKNTQSGIPVRADRRESADEKENRPPTRSRTVRFQLPAGPREETRGNRTPARAPSSSARTNLETKTPDEVRRSQRESVESLGLYDKDGFLKNSPDRDSVAKAGRLRM